jgi:hypothetical protein
MDHLYADREKELFKLNAKLNAKTKKAFGNKHQVPVKPIQIVTSNNNFNYYHNEYEEEDIMELKCKKINISNIPIKKSNEIPYPLLNRYNENHLKKNSLSIHIPRSSIKDVVKQDEEKEDKTFCFADAEVQTDKTDSCKSESLITRYSSEASIHIMHTNTKTDVVSRSIEKNNISTDGLLK